MSDLELIPFEVNPDHMEHLSVDQLQTLYNWMLTGLGLVSDEYGDGWYATVWDTDIKEGSDTPYKAAEKAMDVLDIYNAGLAGGDEGLEDGA